MQEFSEFETLRVLDKVDESVKKRNGGAGVIVQSSHRMRHTRLWLYCETGYVYEFGFKIF